jgi:hypothetical protein
MTAPRPTSWTQEPRAKRVQARLSITFMFVGLAAAAGAQYAYRQAFQAPACYDYARKKNLPDLKHLRFTDVRPASKERLHVCYFQNERAGAPVALHFDRADIPTARDAGQLITLIAAFVLSVLVGWWRWRRRLDGCTLPGGFRPAGHGA